MWLDKQVRRVGPEVGMEMDSLVTVAKRRTLYNLLSIMDNDSHLLHNECMINNEEEDYVQRQTAVRE